jgi:CBS-domain-containing membrane protein
MLVALAVVAGLAELSGERLVSASLGATAVIIFALPGSPLAQPRAAVGGQVVAAACGVAVVAVAGVTWFALALAGALALAAMLVTRTLHAPAGATALIAVLEDAGPSFVLVPVLAGTVVLVLVALVVLRARRAAPWPEYWW